MRYDYTQPGAYFITRCTQDRACLFGDVVDGHMQLNVAGQMVHRWWTEAAEMNTAQIPWRKASGLSGSGPDRIRTGDLGLDRAVCWATTPRVRDMLPTASCVLRNTPKGHNSDPPRLLGEYAVRMTHWTSWAGEDSNLRRAFARRFYRPLPLTTRPPTPALPAGTAVLTGRKNTPQAVVR